MREDGRAVYGLGRTEPEFENLQKSLVEEIEQKISAEVAVAHAISVRTLPR